MVRIFLITLLFFSLFHLLSATSTETPENKTIIYQSSTSSPPGVEPIASQNLISVSSQSKITSQLNAITLNNSYTSSLTIPFLYFVSYLPLIPFLIYIPFLFLSYKNRPQKNKIDKDNFQTFFDILNFTENAITLQKIVFAFTGFSILILIFILISFQPFQWQFYLSYPIAAIIFYLGKSSGEFHLSKQSVEKKLDPLKNHIDKL